MGAQRRSPISLALNEEDATFEQRCAPQEVHDSRHDRVRVHRVLSWIREVFNVPGDGVHFELVADLAIGKPLRNHDVSDAQADNSCRALAKPVNRRYEYVLHDPHQSWHGKLALLLTVCQVILDGSGVGRLALLALQVAVLVALGLGYHDRSRLL